MPIVDPPYTSALIALFNKAAASPMSIEEYAAEFAKITDAQILTGEVAPGIPVKTSAGEGATSDKGKLV